MKTRHNDHLAQFLWRVKRVNLKDALSVFPAAAAMVIAPFFRLRHKKIWLVCERREDARDNGYWFYKYLRENHPEIEAVYAIDFNSPDCQKVKKLGKVIRFGSFSHWVHYFAAEKNISSQKEGKPNAALCFVLEVYFNRVKNRVFLQHGITYNNLRWLGYDLTKFQLYTCSAAREHAYIQEQLGYPQKAAALTGFCRYDNLPVDGSGRRQILVMPTMRRWLARVGSDTVLAEGSVDFTESEYCRIWNGFLSDAGLAELLHWHNVQLIFYPHAAVQRFVGAFTSTDENIVIADSANYDVQDLMIHSALMITDYSSVFFDFAYMGKPVIYYQFDSEKFRALQYQEGYFSYEEDGFGPVAYSHSQLMQTLSDYLDKDMKMPEEYRGRVDGFFAFRDTNNCRRVYEAICAMEK